MKRMVFIREIFDWMGNYSGYDQVFAHIEKYDSYRYISVYRKIRNIRPGFKKKIYNYLLPKVNPNPFYNINSLDAEFSAVKRALKKRASVLHISYVENNYGFSSKIKYLLPSKLVGTVHQPPEWWEENHRKKHILKSLDAIIVLSKKVKPYFEQYLPGKVFWIPHGIDTHFFCPDTQVTIEQKLQHPSIVFSGHWLRDIKTLYLVIKEINKRKPGVRFDLLVPKNKRYDEYFKKISRLKQVSWHAGLPDEELRNIYRNAVLLFLPLLACTANNAVLESMACGLPIVSNNVGGIPDYTDPSFAELLPVGDVNNFSDAIVNLIENPDKFKEKSAAARKYAVENFAWDIIANQTLHLYNTVLNQ